MTPVRPLPRAVLVGACASALALAGCSSSGQAPAAPTTSASAQPGGGPPTGQGGRAPGAFGTIAAVDGKTLQVQGNGEQTAVVYTSKTTMTSQIATSAAALAVGDCVSVRTADDSPTASTSPTDANTGTDTLAATTVTILSTSGCDGVAPGGGGFPAGGFPGVGAPPSGRPSGVPSGVPSGMPSGGPPGGRGFGGFGALGEVTATTSGSFTLARIVLGRPVGGASTASPTTSPSSAPATVTYGGDTSFLTTAKVKATAITVGLCVRATGSTDDTGTLTATTLALSQPTDGSCLTGVRGG
jgi:hypothetical protein